MTTVSLGPDLTVHVHATGEGGIFVNAYLVETRAGVVAVDSTLTESDSKALRKRCEALEKPLLAVLVTHPHPDHVAGLTNLVAGRPTRILSTKPVLELMQRLEEPKRAQWTPVFGAEWVQKWTYPNEIVGSGARVEIDGVSYAVLDIGSGGDSEANSVWFMEAPARCAFLSDLTFNGPHSYVADGHLLGWLANLSRLERLCEGMEVVFPGHGAPAAPGVLLSRQRDYLLTLASHVKELAAGRTSLADEEKVEVERRMTARYPDAGLTFLIQMNVDPVARELNRPV